MITTAFILAAIGTWVGLAWRVKATCDMPNCNWSGSPADVLHPETRLGIQDQCPRCKPRYNEVDYTRVWHLVAKALGFNVGH